MLNIFYEKERFKKDLDMLYFLYNIYYIKKGENMRFSDIPEIPSSAEIEIMRYSNNFPKLFFDINNIYKQLNDASNFKMYLVGRKGTGKSAYAMRLSIKDLDKVKNIREMLTNGTFYKLAEKSSNQTESLKFYHLWKLCLYFELIKDNQKEFTEEDLKELDEVLNRFGISLNSDFVENFDSMTKHNFDIGIKKLLAYRYGNEKKELSYDQSLNMLNKFLEKIIVRNFKENIENKNSIIFLDGLDDVPTYEIEYLQCIHALFNIVYDINYLLNKKNIRNKKIILVLRDDILAKINDTNKQKKISDCAIFLNWNKDTLKELYNIKMRPDKYNYIADIWKHFFPEKIRYNNYISTSFNYFLDRSLLRPRDIVEFFSKCRDLYPEHKKITELEFYACVDKFCKDFLWNDFLDELGFSFDEDIINNIKDIIMNVSTDKNNSSTFRQTWFLQQVTRICNNKKESDAKKLLEHLFNRGYIGISQKISGKIKYRYKIFEPDLTINKDDENLYFCIHRGIITALKFNVKN